MSSATIDRTRTIRRLEPPAFETVFVDRDGVINVNRPDHVTRWEELRFLPGALEGLALLRERGHRVFVVTNQAIVGRAQITRAALDALHERMVSEIEDHGGAVADILVCPHRPDEGCGCRKPAPGMLLDAADRHGLRLDEAVLIGDHTTDLEVARRSGCRSILVLSGRTTSWPHVYPSAGCLAVVPDLLAAARLVVGGSTPGPLLPSSWETLVAAPAAAGL